MKRSYIGGNNLNRHENTAPIAMVIGPGTMLGSTAVTAQTHTTGQTTDTAAPAAAPEKNAVPDKVFYKAEIEPDYPGGSAAWIRFLSHNLHYPMDAISNEISGTVVVQFIVHPDSTISDITVLSGPAKGGLREEAIRVVSVSGKWAPGIQNGHVVTCIKKQPIRYLLTVK